MNLFASVVFREGSEKKKIQNCTAAHSAVGARNAVRADAIKCEKRRGACSGRRSSRFLFSSDHVVFFIFLVDVSK